MLVLLSLSIVISGQSNKASQRQGTIKVLEENTNSIPTERVRKTKEPKLSDNRFRFGALLGPLVSQVDGDGYSGYDKLGFYSGIKGEALITRNFFIEIDLMYNRIGSKFPGLVSAFKQNNSRELGFDYAEVPFILNFSIPKNSFVLNLEGGVSLMQLLNTSIIEDVQSSRIVNLTELSKEFNKRSYAALVGAELQFGRLSFGTRASISMTNTYYNEEWFAAKRRNQDTSRLLPLLRNYYIALYTSYTFIGSMPKR